MSSELQGVSERWFQAWLDKDATVVERVAADDYIYIAPSGLTMDRETWEKQAGEWRLVMEQNSFSQ